jgi:hypothetical protein
MFIGYLVTAVSLHGAFLYMLWMIISLIAALRIIAGRYVPAPVYLDAPRSPVATYASTPSHRSDPTLLYSSTTQPLSQSTLTEVSTMQVTQPIDTLSAHSPAGSGPDTDSLASLGSAGSDHASHLAELETWLAAGVAALRRGDLQVARAMADLALERDPYSHIAWDIDLRIRLFDIGHNDIAGHIVHNAPDTYAYDVNEKLYPFWRTNGGLPVFGYPITPRFYEVTPDGEMVEAQYFERARLEYRPNLAGTPGEVENAKLGREVQISGLPVIDLPPGLDGEQVVIDSGQRGIPVPRRFFRFWEANGGPRILGMPFSRVLEGTNEEGQVVWVQYFDKARLEFDPALAHTVYGVQISRLGSLAFAARYGQKVSP